MIKKRKLDEEAMARRSSARASTRRETNKIKEQYEKEVLELIYSGESTNFERVYLNKGSKFDSRAVNATAYVLAERARKVLTSMGINPPLSLQMMYSRDDKKSVSAVTDFKSISICFDMGMIDIANTQKIAELLAALKGVVYHEGGHIMYTLPWKALFDCALMDNGLNPIAINPINMKYSDSFEESYPAYLDVRNDLKSIGEVVTFGERIYDPNLSIKTIQERNWNAHCMQFTDISEVLQLSWNLLEDGRMEHEMVINNPPMINYFTALVLNYIIEEKETGYCWPFVITRLHLDEELLDSVRQLAYKFAIDKGMDVTLVDRIEEQVHVYRQSKTATEVVLSVWQMHNLVTQWMTQGSDTPPPPKPNGRNGNDREGKGTPNPGASDSHDEKGTTKVNTKPTFGETEKGWEINPDDPKGEGKQQPPEDGDNPGGSKPQPGDDGDEGQPKNGNEKGKDSDGDKESLNTTGGNKGTGGKIKHNVDYTSIREELKNMAKEAINSTVSDNEVEEVVAQINQELARDMPHNAAVSNMSGKLLADSMVVANQMLAALEPLALTADPAWRFRQETGVLDPTSYKMHEPGDSDYWVDYEGEGAHGHSLAVSVMLDTSGSMGGWMDQLSVAAYGIRNACDSLEIPCTVSTFDTEPYMIWDNDEVAQPLLIHDGGGTNPLDGLRQIRHQGAGKKRHLVVVLTDGEWSHVSSVKPFAEPGQYWLMIGLGSGEYAKDLVAKKGGDSAISIDDVMNLPKEIEKALIGFLA